MIKILIIIMFIKYIIFLYFIKKKNSIIIFLHILI
jgi:hypothetical protein